MTGFIPAKRQSDAGSLREPFEMKARHCRAFGVLWFLGGEADARPSGDPGEPSRPPGPVALHLSAPENSGIPNLC